jgi:Domain of unknown function (DUF4371)/hAT family C-terminal dimerisation region
MVNEAYLKQVAENRQYIGALGEILLLTATQDIAQRGHRETPGSHNIGNFLEILHLVGRYNPAIATKLKDLPQDAKYCSPMLQNEMIETLADMVRQEIITEVKESGEFSIMADETKDVRKLEQLSLVLRYYHSGEIHESFLQFESAEKLDAASLTEKILTTLEKHGLDYREHLVGQCYDGASVMSGKNNGVAKRIKELARFAFYIHCYAHRLNLVLVDAVKSVPEASNFFSLLERTYVFTSGSYVHRRWLEIQQEMFPDEAPRELQRLSDTRWACRYYACKNFRDRLPALIRLLQQLEDDNNPDRAVEARGLRAQVDGTFILLSVIFCTILSETKTLSDFLQAPGLDLAKSVNLVHVVADRLTALRNEDSFQSVWLAMTNLVAACAIDLPKLRPRRAHQTPVRLHESVIMETTGHRADISDATEFKRHVYFAILDAVKGEMDRRFSEENCAVMTGIESLSPMSDGFLELDAVNKFATAYDSNLEDLHHEVYQAKRLLQRKKDSGMEPPMSLLAFTRFLESYKDAFHELYRLCQIGITLPVSSAGCERSFSSLKRIKTYLRNSMTDSRLDNLGMLSIESDRAKALSIEKFVDIFASKHKNRRITLV